MTLSITAVSMISFIVTLSIMIVSISIACRYAEYQICHAVPLCWMSLCSLSWCWMQCHLSQYVLVGPTKNDFMVSQLSCAGATTFTTLTFNMTTISTGVNIFWKVTKFWRLFCVIILSVVVLSVIMLSVVIHNVVALFSLLKAESYGKKFLCMDVWCEKQLLWNPGDRCTCSYKLF